MELYNYYMLIYFNFSPWNNAVEYIELRNLRNFSLDDDSDDSDDGH